MTLLELIDQLDNSIGAGATPATLRSQLSLLREQGEAIDAEMEFLQTRVHELETAAQDSNSPINRDKVANSEITLLQFILDRNKATIEDAATFLEVAISNTKNSRDHLLDRNMIQRVPNSGGAYTLTPKGRAYIVENKLE